MRASTAAHLTPILLPHTQVLSRDIRSVNQRLNVKPIHPTAAATATATATAGGAAAAVAPANPGSHPNPGVSGAAAAAGGGTAAAGQYHVVLENIYISYDIDPGSGAVQVRDAWVDPITAGLVKA